MSRELPTAGTERQETASLVPMPTPPRQPPSLSDLGARRARLMSWLQSAPPDDPQRDLGIWRLHHLQREILRRGGRLDNPAWLDQALTVSWDRLEPRVPPIVTLLKNGHITAKPYGCGVWGCVLPTVQPGMVLKITNDPSEARLVGLILQDAELQLPGVTRYYDMTKLPMRHENRAVYAIWREEAYEVGEIVSDDVINGKLRTREDTELSTFSDRLGAFQAMAERFVAFKKRQRNAWAVLDEALAGSEAVTKYELVKVIDGAVVCAMPKYPPLRLAVMLHACRANAKLIAEGPRGQLVGQALASFMGAGILLADVHLGNIGNAKRSGHKVVVITDPGVTAPLYRSVEKLLSKAA